LELLSAAKGIGKNVKALKGDARRQAIQNFFERVHSNNSRLRCALRLKARGVCEPEPTRNLTMGLRTSTWISLANVGAELSIEPAEVAKVLLNIIARKNLFADILMLDGQSTSGDE
jgi:hypothetical protein